MRFVRMIAFLGMMILTCQAFGAPNVAQAAEPCGEGRKLVKIIPPPSEARPLSELSGPAATFLAGRDGPLGLAVFVPGPGTMYAFHGDERMPLASVEKVITMVAVMDRAVREGRNLTDHESQLMTLMIEISDNDSAQALWYDLGGAPGIQGYLDELGMESTTPGLNDEWGTTESTPRDMAGLLSKLAMGDFLDEPMRRRALAWMSEVEPEQKWGISAGLAPYESVALKNGWYPDVDGWWVGSVGIVSRNGKPSYVLVILTSRQESFEYGVETIEVASTLIHTAVCDMENC